MTQKLTFLCMLAVLVLGGTEAQAAEGSCNASGDQANADKRRVREFFREEIRVSRPDYLRLRGVVFTIAARTGSWGRRSRVRA
jgi:hypothetical protein